MRTRRNLLFVLMILFGSFSTNAQIAKWIVYPEYDNIEMLDNGLLKVTKNGKVGLLNKSGAPVLPVEYEKISAFYEDRALLFKNGRFVAITDLYGTVIDLSNEYYDLVEDFDRFYSDYLIVKKNNLYYYLNRDGRIALGPYLKAYPFSEGWACVTGMDNLYDHVNEIGKSFYDVTGVIKNDISFISSFYNGKAIIAIRKKFYTVDKEMYRITPISIDETQNKKSLVVAMDKVISVHNMNNGYVVNTINGKFFFDNSMRLTKMELQGNDPVVNTFPEKIKRDVSSLFKIITDGELFGLSYETNEILPPQFEDVSYIEDDLAFVKSNGYYGVVSVDKHNDFIFKLNDNENIGFNHRSYTSKLTVYIPSYLKCSKVTAISNSDDCEIQIETRSEYENIEKNALTYNCRLYIPMDLTDDTLKIHDYNFSLMYDGFLSKKYKVSISEWHVKYYEINISNTNYSLESVTDTISIEFDLIKTDVAKNDETNYYKNVEVIAANMTEQPVLNKITENHYSFQISNIDQERVLFTIKITEEGCPSIKYPFEMVFTKPKPEEKNQKTSVKIKAVRKNKGITKEEEENEEDPLLLIEAEEF